MLTNSPSSAALLLRLVGLGGGTGGCLAWGGTGGGVSAEGGAVKEGRGGSSPIRDTVLGGLATAMGTEDEEEEEEEDDEEEEEGVALVPGSVEDVVRNFGGSRACLGRGGSCGVSSFVEGLWTNWTLADSTEGLHTKQTQTLKQKSQRQRFYCCYKANYKKHKSDIKDRKTLKAKLRWKRSKSYPELNSLPGSTVIRR